jgi:RimJ/RimL family protein N-acetyltransferase
MDPVLTTPRLRLELLDAAGNPWGRRRIVRAFDGLVVGDLEFYGRPETGDDGVTEVELGCRLDEAARGHGAGAEALLGVLGRTDALGVRVLGRVAPTDTRAVRVLAGCGFTQLRCADEDGNLVMVRPLP